MGIVSSEGTRRYTERMAAVCAPGHFRAFDLAGRSLHLSSIGLGSYTGPATDAADEQYAAALQAAVRRGINVVDCAINYRHMRSERALGQGIRVLLDSGEAARDEIFVMSKGGYLPFDGGVPSNVSEYLRQTYLDSGIVQPDELVAGSHCISPRFLEDQLQRSLDNFGLEAIDVYFLHNVEQQLDEVPPDEFLGRVERAFAVLEQAVAAGRLACYGVATWNGLRVPQEAPNHLSLERLVQAARRVAGDGHRFRVIQLPYNLGMPEALNTPTQGLAEGRVTLLEAAAHFGMMVVTSVPLLQTQLLSHVPAGFAAAMPGLTTAAQRAIQFVRSTPGVFAPLVGMRTMAHVAENAAVAAVPPLPAEGFLRLLER